MKLDIGCGLYKRGDDFIGVDFYVDGVDVKAEMWSIPFPDACVDEIWSSHALEHVPMGKVPEVLREWLRILKPGGRAIIQVPNFDYVARYWLTGGDRRWAEMMIFGQQTHAGEFHKSGFNPELLRGDLEGTGWKVDRIEHRSTHNQDTLQAVAHKPTEAECRSSTTTPTPTTTAVTPTTAEA